jgi:hypothetical protein
MASSVQGKDDMSWSRRPLALARLLGDRVRTLASVRTLLGDRVRTLASVRTLVAAHVSRWRRSLGLAGLVVAAGIACLLAFHPASHADPGRTSTATVEPAAVPHVTWQPTVVGAPGLPVQCADGSWTRTAVRGGCAHHGGVVY